jgi:hypothetical protein
VAGLKESLSWAYGLGQTPSFYPSIWVCSNVLFKHNL